MQVAVIPIHLGVHLTKLLEARALSTAQLADKTGLSPTLIGALVSTQQILTADVALALSEALEVPVLELLELQRAYYTAIRETALLRQMKAA